MTTELNANTFDEFIQSADKPVSVDFWAPWCGPCRMIAPLIDELSNEMSEEVIFAKMDIEEFPEFGKRYSVMSIPAFAMFKEGQFGGLVPTAGGYSKSRLTENIRIAIAL